MAERSLANKVAYASITAGALVFMLVCYVLWQVMHDTTTHFAAVASLILVGLAGFIGMMNLLSVTASWLKISDARQPFGLPEGTVRAILTIAFIILVGVLSGYMITNGGGQQYSRENAIELKEEFTDAMAKEFIANNSATGIIVKKPIPSKPDAFTISIYPKIDTRLVEDITKQILTMLSTILAAMIGFYFASRTTDGPSGGGGGGGGDGGGGGGEAARKMVAHSALSALIGGIDLDEFKRLAARLADPQGKLAQAAGGADAAAKTQFELAQKAAHDVAALEAAIGGARRAQSSTDTSPEALESALKTVKAAVGKLDGLSLIVDFELHLP